MCPTCLHSWDDHDGAGNCLTCTKVGRRCPGRGWASVTIHIAGGGDHLTPVTMPASTSPMYAARRAAEALGLDPEARDWFLYDPVASGPLTEGEVIAPYDGRVLSLAWTEVRG